MTSRSSRLHEPCKGRKPGQPLPIPAHPSLLKADAAQADRQLTNHWSSIIQDPQNPTLYTNRAMARLNLKLWESVISDCQACLDISSDNMKAFYYLSQAEIALNRNTDALEHALRAHELCVMSNDKSMSSITAQVLRCKKECWETSEKRRVREGTELEAVVLALMEKECDEALADATNESDRREIAEEWQQKISRLRAVFEKARSPEDKKRTVPDWAIDDISFAVMLDPVIVSIPCVNCIHH